MEKFKKTIFRKTLYTAIYAFIYLAACCTITLLQHQGIIPAPPEGAKSDFISGFQFGIGIAFFILILLNIISGVRALLNVERLKRMYIKETDERSKEIVLRSSSFSLSMLLMSLAGATAIAGFFNHTVFLTLLIVVLFSVAIFNLSYLYFKQKI